MTLNRLIICLLVLLVSYVVAINLYDLYQELVRPVPMLVVNASAMGASIDVKIDEADSWTTVIKTIAIILGTFLGIKLINKYIKK